MRRRRASTACICGAALLAAACAAGQAAAADADARDALVAQCRDLQQPQPKEAIAVCERAYAALDPLRDGELAEEMLFRRSDAQIATGAFAEAAATLDRVAAMPVEAGRWMHDFRLARRRGILAYRQERYAEALPQFRVARELALAHADDTSVAQSWNDLGNTLRRIGDYHGALDAYLASLELKRRGNDRQLGALYNNLGDLYRDLGDLAESKKRYVEALAEHDRDARPRDAAHTRESLAAVLVKTGETAEAIAVYRQVIETFRGLGARADELRAQVGLAAIELDRDGVEAARAALTRAQALAGELSLPLPPNLAVQLARLHRADGDPAAARRVLGSVLDRVADDSADRVPLLRANAEAARAAGDAGQAYALLDAYHDADTRLRDAAHDRRLAQLRVQFDVAERERAIEKLETQNRLAALALQQRTTQLQLGLACALVVLLLVAGLFLRARQRSQLAAAVRESQLAAETDHYRRAAAALRADSERVQALLDRGDAALFAIDAGGTLVALTARAAELLGRSRDAALGTPFADLLDATSRETLERALSELEDHDADVPLQLRLPAATVAARLGVLPTDGDIAVLQVVPIATDAVRDGETEAGEPAPAAELVPFEETPLDDAPAEVDNERFRRQLVELMVYAVEIWERVSGRTRIDLAEKSRVWRVTIDEGRLRVRAMERYLSLAKLPRQPRWREVLRTAFYVLSECRLDMDERELLRTRAETVQASLRRRALL